MRTERMIDIPAADVQSAVDIYILQNWTILRRYEQPNGLWTIEAQEPAKGKPPKASPPKPNENTVVGFTEPGIPFATPPKSTVDDRLALARTIYGEARGQPKVGMEAVANVVLNRVKSGRYPNSVAQVCLQPFQFSCWNKNDPNRAKMENLKPGANHVFDECLEIADDALAGVLPDHTFGATHYYANYIAEPFWVKKSPMAQRTATIGVHLFFVGIA